MTKMILRNDPAKKRRKTKLCDGSCGNVYEMQYLSHFKDDDLMLCNECAFDHVASMSDGQFGDA